MTTTGVLFYAAHEDEFKCAEILQTMPTPTLLIDRMA